MTKIYNLTGDIQAISHENPQNGRELAEAIAAGGVFDPANYDDIRAINDIASAQRKLLTGPEMQAFLEFDKGIERHHYRFESGEIAVYWVNGPVVEVGCAKELAQEKVRDFRSYQAEEAEDAAVAYRDVESLLGKLNKVSERFKESSMPSLSW